MNDCFFQMRVSEDFLRKLDDARRAEPDLPSRSKLARRLLKEAMDERSAQKVRVVARRQA